VNGDADLRRSIRIEAPPETVWAALTDPESHSRWNTLFSISGEVSVDARPRVRLRVPGLPPVWTRPRVTDAEFPELAWTTRVPGLRADHLFRATPDEGVTLFEQFERFEGPLSRPVRLLDRPVLRGFEQFNRGLKRHAESLADDDPDTA